MASIELNYVNGEEVYTCTECNENINSSIVEDYIYEISKFCPNCGAKIEDVEI